MVVQWHGMENNPKGPLRYPKLPKIQGSIKFKTLWIEGSTLSFVDVRTFTCPQPSTNQGSGGITGPITGAFSQSKYSGHPDATGIEFFSFSAVPGTVYIRKICPLDFQGMRVILVRIIIRLDPRGPTYMMVSGFSKLAVSLLVRWDLRTGPPSITPAHGKRPTSAGTPIMSTDWPGLTSFRGPSTPSGTQRFLH